MRRAISVARSNVMPGDQPVSTYGFLRAPNGTFTTFDVPGSNSGDGAGTVPASINSSGTITGTYFVNLNISHCFVRNAADGTIVALDDPPNANFSTAANI